MAEQQFAPVVIYDGEGEFLGYGIHKISVNKLQHTHLYGDTDDDKSKLQNDLEDLNNRADVAEHWPAPDDPEYLSLVNDPTFMPIEYTEQEVLDDAEIDRMMADGRLDPEEDLFDDPVTEQIQWKHPEKLPMTMAKMPADPALPAARMRKAAETIALRRAAANE